MASADDDHLIHIDTDSAEITLEGRAVAHGNVHVRQDARTVTADTVVYDEKTGKVTVQGSVNFEDPKLHIDGASGTYDAVGAANFDEANFQILQRHGRGSAQEIAVSPEGRIDLQHVRYTTCPVGNHDWMLKAASLDFDTALQQGVGRDVVMRFKDVPVLYTPYISFPLGDERKSGLLFPVFGHSTIDGFELDVPYYFNLAPNYDLTLTPGVLSARGERLAGEFRYLTPQSNGRLEATFLPSDAQTHSDRSYLHYTDVTDFQRGLRFEADIASVSDSNYFQDFAVGSEQTSVTYLERRAEVKYYDDTWRIRGELQNFQTIDITVPAYQRPYSSVPRIQADALWPLSNSGLEVALSSEAAYFLRDAGPAQCPPGYQPGCPIGARLDVSPELRWSSRGPGYFFEPAVGYHLTQYDLQNTVAGEPTTPSRALPYVRLDSGLVFERDAGAGGQRTQTLEPRIMYSYVPYRNQDNLPIFDSGLPDLNMVELFRTNRYVGDDRISDANQIAVALTTRLFDQNSGAQYLSATLGQVRYLSIPRVTLPASLFANPALGLGYGLDAGPYLVPLQRVNMFALPGLNQNGYLSQNLYTMPGTGQYAYLVTPRALAATQNQIAELYGASDLVSEVALTAYKNFNVDLNYQWNPYTSQTDKSEVSVQYRPDPSRVLNLGYRFQQGIFKQWDGSVAWPITSHWGTVGRWVYSIPDKQTIEQVAGVSYKSCCWRVELVQRRYLINRFGGLDTSIALQLELTGLSSVGKPADAFLEQEIRGYSSRDPQNP